MTSRGTADTPSAVRGLLLKHSALTPTKVALSIGGQVLTWQELADSVAEVGHVLEKLGVPSGANVGIFMPNSLAWAVWAYACAVTGRTIVPLNVKLLVPELAYQVAQSDCALVVSSSQSEALWKRLSEAVGHVAKSGGAVQPRCISIDELRTDGTMGHLEKRLEEFSDVPDSMNLIIQYTSGTTAQPKGVMLSHYQVVLNSQGVAGRLRLTCEDRIASPSPFFHVAGTTLLLFLGLVSGASVYSWPRFDPEVILKDIEAEAITVYNGVDSLFIGLMKAPQFARHRMSSIRTGWIASSRKLVQQVHEEMGLTGIVNVYGLSEAAANVTIPDVDDPVSVRYTCGRPHSGMSVRITDIVTGLGLRANEVGLIEVSGPCIMAGYYRKRRETADAFTSDGWLKTGDRGYIEEDGNLTYLGREKDILRVGGENVAPAEVEAAILAHPSVAGAAVVGIPHETLVEVPAAFVVPKEGSELSGQDVADFLEGRLASFKLPRIIRMVDSLPMTGSEKIQKYRLRMLLEEEGGGR